MRGRASHDASGLREPGNRGNICGIGAPQGRLQRVTANDARSAKAGQDCNAVPKEERRCPESAARCSPSGRVKSAM
nr:MAG TPA: hypothetical protein [Caudoviricetes sp.]